LGLARVCPGAAWGAAAFPAGQRAPLRLAVNRAPRPPGPAPHTRRQVIRVSSPATLLAAVPEALDGAEQRGQWPRYPVEANRLGQQPSVAELAPRARAEEAPQLRRLVLAPPGGLPLDGAERAEVPV
jgi:hypothetical protein